MKMVVLIIQIGIFAAFLYIVVRLTGDDSNGRFSMTKFIYNCWLGLKRVIYLALGGIAMILLIIVCKFFFQTPSINRIQKDDVGIMYYADSVMVCDSEDSTRCYTTQEYSPGRLERCLNCQHIYIQHHRWLTPAERAQKEYNERILSEIVQGLASDP